LPSACPGFAAVIPALPDRPRFGQLEKDCVACSQVLLFLFPWANTATQSCKINKPVNGDIVNRLLGFIAVTKRHAGFLASFSLYGSLSATYLPPISRQEWEVLSTNVVIMNFVRNRVIPALLRVSYPTWPPHRATRPVALMGYPQIETCMFVESHESAQTWDRNSSICPQCPVFPGISQKQFRDARLYPRFSTSASTRLPELRVSTEFCELFP